jgi:uncharacterized Ntn-hydrolase superfamily protein
MKQFCSFIFVLAFSALNAQDTFSIVAVDSVTGEVGSAGASCLQAPNPPIGCLIISDVMPGIGAIHTQAQWNADNQSYAHQMLADEHRAPQAIIDELVQSDADNDPTIRQYGIAAFDSAGHPVTAGYTGASCFDYKNHVLGSYYSVQGNILLGQQILDSMEARFLHTPGSLADRLMAALQGANVAGADTRCMSEGIPAQSAFVRVARPTDSDTALYLHLVVKSRPYGMSPVDSLQTLFNQWKQTHTGIPEVTEEEIKVSPNPASNNCTIQFTGGKERSVEVYDLMGKKMFEQTCFVRSQFSVADWAKGIYFIRTGNTVRKLLVQ